MKSNGNGLATLSKATRMLAEATTIQDIMAVENLAQRARDYAKAAGMGREATNNAAIIMLNAQRKAGETLIVMKARGELADGKPQPSQPGRVTLGDLEITYNRSSRYQQAASVPEAQYMEWIEAACESDTKELTSSGLRKLAKQGRRSWAEPQEAVEGTCRTLAELIELGKRFRCIYADPPWGYGNQATRASTDNHYDTMSVEAIAAEPVGEVSEANCHLHLWTTNAFLFDAKQVMDAWGFEYKSVFVWVKPQIGIGNYWRVSHEFLLLGVKGKATNFLAKDESSWAMFDRGQHSRKPKEVRQKIERVSPGPYLEMYGREVVPGWTVYGNQIEVKPLCD